MFRMKNIIAYLLLVLFSSFLFAETFTWTGKESTIWNTAGNWETDSGATGPPSFPPTGTGTKIKIPKVDKGNYPVYTATLNKIECPADVITISEGATLTIKCDSVPVIEDTSVSGSGTLVIEAPTVKASVGAGKVTISAENIVIKATGSIDLSSLTVGDANSTVTLDCPPTSITGITENNPAGSLKLTKSAQGVGNSYKLTAEKYNGTLKPGDPIDKKNITVKVEIKLTGSSPTDITRILKSDDFTIKPEKIPANQTTPCKITVDAKENFPGCKSCECEIPITPDPDLVLQSLTIFGQTVPVTGGNPSTITVSNDKTRIEDKDIVATFTQSITPASVTIEDGPKDLNDGTNQITLKVVEKIGSYKAWTKTITIQKDKDPDLVLQSLKIFEVPANINVSPYTVTVSNDKTKITSNDIKATFTDGTTTVISVTNLEIEDGPKALTVGTNKIILKVNAVTGKYQEWKKEVDIVLQSKNIQVGGVIIKSNVVDINKGSKTTIEINIKNPGSLTVSVMTSDGSIIQTLHRGYATEGTHTFTWNGKTRSGSNVARGIYFIRVVGPNIDETRKVMIVK